MIGIKNTVVDKHKARIMMNQNEDNMWIAQLKAAARTIPTVYASTEGAAYINKWLRDRSVKDSLFRFTLKMWLSQLPTLENISLWNAAKNNGFYRTYCVCGEKGTADHILSGQCSRTRGKATKRHNEIGKMIREETTLGTVARWSYIGDFDQEVPYLLVGSDWKRKIPSEIIIDRDGIKRMCKHTKPDLILADLLSNERSLVLIIDFTIVSEHTFKTAGDEKRRRYEPLVRAILEWLGKGDHRVEVVPVVVGRNGIPPHDWSQLCGKMKIASKPKDLWSRIMTCVLEYNTQMFSMWQHCNGLR
jgi:hypothetical protein